MDKKEYINPQLSWNNITFTESTKKK